MSRELGPISRLWPIGAGTRSPHCRVLARITVSRARYKTRIVPPPTRTETDARCAKLTFPDSVVQTALPRHSPYAPPVPLSPNASALVALALCYVCLGSITCWTAGRLIVMLELADNVAHNGRPRFARAQTLEDAQAQPPRLAASMLSHWAMPGFAIDGLWPSHCQVAGAQSASTYLTSFGPRCDSERSYCTWGSLDWSVA